MVESLLCCVPVARVHLEQHSNKIFCILGNALPISCIEAEIAKTHFSQHVSISFSIKGWISTEDHVHDDTKTPKICALVIFACQDLWSHVVGCSCLGSENLLRTELASESKVNHLECALLDWVLGREQEVFRLQIAVDDVILVHVEYRPEHVLHDDGRLHLCEVPGIDDAIKQLSACAELHHQIDVAMVFERLVQLDDIGVVHDLHDCNFLLEAIKVLHLRL
mmetsp:Transcript_62086/g.114379  ORF Transcript_62086/g.114379 Transcript_62086/m.114379 type:complete len:222 (+) Transcript_62086:645-1310(+)